MGRIAELSKGVFKRVPQPEKEEPAEGVEKPDYATAKEAFDIARGKKEAPRSEISAGSSGSMGRESGGSARLGKKWKR